MQFYLWVINCIFSVPQLFEFSVNMESNEKGDFLLHVACRSGICQLPLILSLVRLQNADVDLCNAEGMTPLMIASEAGDSVLCDVSLKKLVFRRFGLSLASNQKLRCAC